MWAACVTPPAEFASLSPARATVVMSARAPSRTFIRTVPVSASPSVPAPAAAPAQVPTQADLLDFVRRTAADAELIASLPLDPEGRTWVRLEGPGGSEAWLIGWPPGSGTGWHDHAESVGAFLTASGELKENSLAARLPSDGWKTLELEEGVDRERR